jgi:hypothetical protein
MRRRARHRDASFSKDRRAGDSVNIAGISFPKNTLYLIVFKRYGQRHEDGGDSHHDQNSVVCFKSF